MAFTEDGITAIGEVIDLNVLMVLHFVDQIYVELLRKLILRSDLIENRSNPLVVQMNLRKFLFITWSIVLDRS